MFKNSLLLFFALTFVTNSANAQACASALRSLERKLAAPTKACADSSPVQRLEAKLAKAKTERLKQSIRKAIDTAKKRQAAQCSKRDAAKVVLAKIEDFCFAAKGLDAEICKEGTTVSIKGARATLRCKTGKQPVELDDESGCYKVDEYYYNNALDYNNGLAHPKGKIFGNRIWKENSFYMVITMTLVRGVSVQDCQ